MGALFCPGNYSNSIKSIQNLASASAKRLVLYKHHFALPRKTSVTTVSKYTGYAWTLYKCEAEVMWTPTKKY